MARYTFRCPNGTEYTGLASMDDIWAPCPHCGVPGPRDLHADLLTHSIDAGDPFRRYHLSSQKERVAGEQGRPIGGPTDNFERKRMEKMFNRQYIGDDASSLRPISQRAVERGKV